MTFRARLGFTLIEVLIVIAILGILAAILFPTFVRVKASAKGASCLSNVKEIGEATIMYVTDNDGIYPQTKRASSDPATQDADGGIEDPDYGDIFVILDRYVGRKAISEAQLPTERIYACPEDIMPFGSDCLAANPDTPSPTSYLVNGYYVWGLLETQVVAPSDTIFLAERRSTPNGGVNAFCDVMYRPWFSPLNPLAPEDQMDPVSGAVATTRHSGHSTFGFADGHAKSMPWGATYAPPGINLHDPSLGG